MLKVENRESAHIRSRVKDLSVVPNVASYNALLAAITPISKVAKNEATGLYEPVLIRDKETLIANFGDPRIDPEKFVDLYAIMKLIGNGGTCYLAKVNSGNAGIYQFPFLEDPRRDDDTTSDDQNTINLAQDANNKKVFKKDDLKNKYVVTSLKGYKNASSNEHIFYSAPFNVIGDNGIDSSNAAAEDANLPTSEEDPIDYTGKYTWECKRKENGKFDLVITLTEELDSDVTLVASGSIDPNWGAEPLEFTDLAFTNDVENKVTIVTYTTDDDITIENEYVITGFKQPEDDPEQSKLKKLLNGSTYDTTLKGNKLELTFTVPYNTTGNTSTPVFNNDDQLPSSLTVERATRKSHSLIAYSSMNEELSFKVYLTQVKPYSIRAYYLVVEVYSNNGTNKLGEVKIKLESTTTNQGIVNAINSAIGTIVRFELMDPSTASACGVKERGANSIAQALLDTFCTNKMTPNPQPLEDPLVIERPSFMVTVTDYIDALKQYKAKKYVGCLMADMVCPVTHDVETAGESENSPNNGPKLHNGEVIYPLNYLDRRSLHFNMKDIAFERKDTTVLLSTPYTPSYDNLTVLTINDACDWVASQGMYSELWEYGQGATTDYATQSFYLEMYYSWLEMTCDWIENGVAKSKKVKIAPTGLVMDNVLTSWRERGVQYPVAGDQGGVLPDNCTVLMNPKTKLERDQLVQYRINPIWDTGTRGVQIFGNETLNAGYTDLNAAHIARTLIYIRSAIDEYTEKLKFSINNLLLWDKWKTYVTQYILEPLISVNALKEYRIAMGEDTTSREEIANRQINGLVQLIFYQSAEVFDLTYVVYSTSTTIDEAMANS